MRVVIAGILGGIAMYVWASVAHLSPLAAVGVHTIPNENLVVAALRLSLGDKGGVYIYPAPAQSKSGGGAAAKAPAPEGMLAYTPGGTGALTPRQLGIEFALELIESLLLAALVALAPVGFGQRVALAALVGVIAGMATNFSYWNWYGFGLDYTAANAFMELMKFVVAGLVIAAMLRPKKTAT
jgi:hypothetical protein